MQTWRARPRVWESGAHLDPDWSRQLASAPCAEKSFNHRASWESQRDRGKSPTPGRTPYAGRPNGEKLEEQARAAEAAEPTSPLRHGRHGTSNGANWAGRHGQSTSRQQRRARPPSVASTTRLHDYERDPLNTSARCADPGAAGDARQQVGHIINISLSTCRPPPRFSPRRFQAASTHSAADRRRDVEAGSTSRSHDLGGRRCRADPDVRHVRRSPRRRRPMIARRGSTNRDGGDQTRTSGRLYAGRRINDKSHPTTTLPRLEPEGQESEARESRRTRRRSLSRIYKGVHW